MEATEEVLRGQRVMESHELYQLAMHRGDAKAVAHEMGYRSGGEVPRRWRRPLATATNLFTGELSPLMKAKAELLAHDRVNPETADILLFDLVADLARQRSLRGEESLKEVVSALASGYHLAIEALLSSDASKYEREISLYRAGGAVVRATVFVLGHRGAGGAPLMRVTDTDKQSFVERVWATLRGI